MNCSCSALLAVVVLACVPAISRAQVQPQPRERILQLGLAVIPGVGAEVGYISPRGFYTLEAVGYADATPPFYGGEGSLAVSLGLGAAVRPLGLIGLIANTGESAYEVDVGLRLGPSLVFPYGASSRQRNPFSLFIEPFVRFESSFSNRRSFFVELGIQRPLLRGGLWLSF